MTRTVPPGGENERALSIRLLITWPSREFVAEHDEAAGPPPSNDSVTVTPSSRCTSLATPTTVVEQLAQIDRLGVLALQFGIEPAGVGDIGDQPVEPLHVVLDDREQPRAAVVGLGERQRLDRASAARSAGSSVRARRRRQSSRSPRCGCRARWSCRAARPTDGRSRRAGG